MLQIVARLGEVAMFTSGFYLGKEEYTTAVILLIFRMAIGTTTSEIMYKRMKSVTREEVNHADSSS